MTYQVTIIIALGWYTEALREINKDFPELPNLGAFHMLNIYQYWIFLEIVTYYMNFAGIIINLASASICHLKMEKVLKVPLAMLRNE
jgi:hypothetical protein